MFIVEIFAFVLALVWLASSVKVVRQQTVALIVESFGRFSGILRPAFPFEAEHRADLRVNL
jgi:regulator of protease activity HflC (stomatin/prohibitin superfamily)